MRNTFRVTALLLVAALIVPPPARAAETLQQQVQQLQQQMQQLLKERDQDRDRIEKLEHTTKAAPHTKHVSASSSSARYTYNAPTMNGYSYSGTTHYVPAPQPYAAPAPQTGQYNGATSTTAESIAPPASTGGDGTYGTPAPTAGAVKSVYQQENAVFNRGFTVTPGATYTYGDNRFFTLNGFMALGAIFLGNIDVSRQQSTIYEPNVNVAYGVSKRLQFDVTVPFVYRSSVYSSQGAQTSSATVSDHFTNSGGLGDITAGFYYQLKSRTLGAPATILNAHLTVPTGISPFGIKVYQGDSGNDNISFVNTLPTGQGAYGLQVGATMIKTLDPAVVFGGVSYNYNFMRHYADLSPYADQVLPGTVQPGGALSFTIGTAFSLNDKMSTSFSFQDSVVSALREKADGPRNDWTNVVGSTLNAAVFNIGATYAVNKNLSYQTVLAIGVTQDAPNFQLSIRIPHYF